MINVPPQSPAEIRVASNENQEEAIKTGMQFVGCNAEELSLAPFVLMSLQDANFNGLILYHNIRNPNDLRAMKPVITSANSRGIKVAMIVCNLNPPGSYQRAAGGVPWYVLGKDKYQAARLHGGAVIIWIQK